METIKIYIDHTIADTKLAYSIHQILKESNINCTVDYYSNLISSSAENWESKIPKLLQQTDVVLIVVSKNYLENFLTPEIAEIISSFVKKPDKLVLPIITEELDIEKPVWFTNIKLIDLNGVKSIESAFGEIKFIISLFSKIKLFYIKKVEDLNSKYLKRISEYEEEIRKAGEDRLNPQNQIASFKSRLMKMLSQNKIEEIIRQLNELDVVKKNVKLRKSLINCSSRFHRLNGLIRSGTLNQDEIFMESNKINDGLFDIITSITEVDE